MSFARPKANANGEWIREQQTELSDIIRARNKREDRMLNVQLKFFEREAKVRLNMIRREKSHFERVRSSISEEVKEIQKKRQSISRPGWLSSRPKTSGQKIQVLSPELMFPDWEINSGIIETESMVSNVPPKINVIRRHSTR